MLSGRKAPDFGFMVFYGYEPVQKALSRRLIMLRGPSTTTCRRRGPEQPTRVTCETPASVALAGLQALANEGHHEGTWCRCPTWKDENQVP